MPFIREQIEANAGGSTVGTYTIETACKTRIFNPPMDEQKKFLALVHQNDKSKFTATDMMRLINQITMTLNQFAGFATHHHRY